MSKFLTILVCPSRRRAQGGPCAINPVNATLSNPGMKVNKTDYAANGGSGNPFKASGPDLSCLTTYPNCDFGQYDDTWMYTNFTGVVGMRTEIRRITNGEGQTFFAGEKYLDPSNYYTGPDPSDAGSCMQGHDYNNIRFCTNASLGGSVDLPPMTDTPNGDLTAPTFGGSTRFGSAIPGA